MTLDVLDAHRDLVLQLDMAEKNLESMQASILHASYIDGMPHAGGASRKTEALAVKVSAQREVVESYKRAVTESEKRVLPFINAIRDNSTHLIFYYRFIAGMEWKTVAEVIGGRNSEDAVKSVCYRYLRICQTT